MAGMSVERRQTYRIVPKKRPAWAMNESLRFHDLWQFMLIVARSPIEESPLEIAQATGSIRQ